MKKVYKVQITWRGDGDSPCPHGPSYYHFEEFFTRKKAMYFLKKVIKRKIFQDWDFQIVVFFRPLSSKK